MNYIEKWNLFEDYMHTGAVLEFICFNSFVFIQNTIYSYELCVHKTVCVRFQNDFNYGTHTKFAVK